MKRYLLFVGDTCYPWGGWRDFYSSYDSIDDARVQYGDDPHRWWHVIDSQSGSVVAGWTTFTGDPNGRKIEPGEERGRW